MLDQHLYAYVELEENKFSRYNIDEEVKRMKKPMLTVDELVQYMKDKGIKFSITTEADAKKHLCAHNNYFKLTSYRKNYTKRTSGASAGQYVNLEFAYLRELARIDTEIRHILLDMSLDIEHFLKVALIKAVEDKKGIDGEDGYKIVSDFLMDEGNDSLSERTSNVSRRTGSFSRKVNQNKNNPYCGGLAARYGREMPVWAFVELISFGDLKELVQYYAARTDWTVPVDLQSLDRVRQIRNACAHGNGIIYDLRPDNTSTGKSDAPLYISQYVYSAGISKVTAHKKLSNPRVSQIVHLLYVYDKMVTSEHTRSMRISQLKELVNNRCRQNEAYFASNPLLTSTHQFFVKLLETIN